MKKNLIRQLFLLLLCISCFNAFSQNQILGSIRKGTNMGEVDLYFKSNWNNTVEYFTSIQVAFSIPMASSSATTALSCISSNLPSITVADFNVGITSATRVAIGTEAVFKCIAVNSTLVPYTFSLGQEFKVATFRLNDASANSTLVKLKDYLSDLIDNAYFIVKTNLSTVSASMSTQKFYASVGSTIGTDNLTDGYAQTSTPIVLPVILIDFTASKNNLKCNTDIKWLISSETNFKNYEVQRSKTSNFLNYDIIANIAGETKTKYTNSDERPLAGINYYRLKMIDKDSEFSYSKIISVNINCKNEKMISLWPNPAIDVVNISGYIGKSKIIVYNALGNQMQNYTTTNTSQQIRIQGLATGTYTIKVFEENGTISNLKVEKQ